MDREININLIEENTEIRNKNCQEIRKLKAEENPRGKSQKNVVTRNNKGKPSICDPWEVGSL